MTLWHIVAAVLGGALASALFWVPVRALDEARWARERRPAPGSWLLDRSGCWWCPVDGLESYVRVPPEVHPQRVTMGPKDPPQPVDREWISREIGIQTVIDPRDLDRVEAPACDDATT